MRSKGFAFVIIQLCFVSIACGQTTGDVPVDSLQEISFSGSIDTYYHNSFKTEQTAPRTSFSNLPGFSLGMVNFLVEYSGSKTGFVTDLVFGPRGTDAIFNAPRYKNTAGAGSSQTINQMYVYYILNRCVRLNVGQFNTFVGYETISPAKNIHYSTSYLFSYGPFNHTGVWADLKLGKHAFAKLAIMNPTDFTEFNPYGLYTVGGQLGISKKNSLLTLNFTYGDPDGQLAANDSVGSVSSGNALQADLTGSLTAGEKYTLGISASVRSNAAGQMKLSSNDKALISSCGYYGIALYQTLSLSAATRIALRTEYFSEFNNGIGAIGTYNSSGRASVTAFTLSANFTRSHLRFIPEVRIDKTSTRSFTESATGKSVHHMMSVNLAVVYEIPAIIHKMKL
jgi:hypothetical protein